MIRDCDARQWGDLQKKENSSAKHLSCDKTSCNGTVTLEKDSNVNNLKEKVQEISAINPKEEEKEGLDNLGFTEKSFTYKGTGCYETEMLKGSFNLLKIEENVKEVDIVGQREREKF